MCSRFPAPTIAVATVLFLLTTPSAIFASYTSTVAAGTATMIGDAANDVLIIVDDGGNFRHNRSTAGDPGFESDFDFDSVAAGVQMLSSETGIINVNAGDGDDTIVLGDGVNLRGTVDGGVGADTIDYAAFTAPVHANLGLGTTGLSGTMGGNQEVPPTPLAASGTATVTNYNIGTHTFDLSVTVTGVLSADVIGFHIHQAAAGVNGPIIVDFTNQPRVPTGDGFTFTAVGLVLPAVSEAAFLGGGTYINVHTPTFAGGAIRGQLFSAANATLGAGTATGLPTVTGFESVNGGTANDSLVGSSAINTLAGGGGIDWIVGGPGNDILNGDPGDDLVVWSNGDGSDVIEGGADGDTVLVNGSTAAGDSFMVQANGPRVRFDRINLGLFNLDIGTTETLTVNGVGGADTFHVIDLPGVASLTTVNLNGFDGDDIFTFEDPSAGGLVFNVHGANGIDAVQGPDAATTWNVTAANQGSVAGLVASFRFVELLTSGSKADTFNVKGFATGALSVNGGANSVGEPGDVLTYDAESRIVTGDTVPPDGIIQSPGVMPVAFTQIETVNITNPAPTIAITDVTAGEGGSGAVFTVTLSGPSPFMVTVDYASADGTATAPADYVAVSNTLTFLPGETLKVIPVTVNVDAVPEPAETFVINLSNAANAVIGDAQGVGTITDNTVPTITGIADQTVAFNTATGAIPFTVGDVETPAASLVVSGSSSNVTLVPNANITFGGSGTARTVTLTPATSQAGTSTITVTVTDASGASSSTTFLLTVNQPTTVQAPTDLYVSAMSGGLVTFRFTPAPLGPPATGFVLEGGISPGQVLASIPTGSASPIYSVLVPDGSFYARVHATRGSERSAASNEIRLHVNVPVAPSAPDLFSSTVNGNSVVLTWRNTFGGAAPAGIVLDVTGAATASFPLGLTEIFAVNGVPAGTYQLRMRAVNGAGTSAQSAPVTVTIPSPCLSPPEMPANFLAYRVGSTIFVVWDPAATGPAAAGYVLNVVGSFVGSFPVTGRSISGQVGPGSYTIDVVAVNSCGSSPPTPPQTVVVP